jgi:threonine/homoserine/homoserine lactone efflux protein
VRAQDGSVALQILVLATVLNIIGFVVNGVVILSASHFMHRLLRGRRQSRLPNYLLGSVFAALAFRLAIASRE